MNDQLEAIKILAGAAHRDGAVIVSEIGSQTVWLNTAGDHPGHLYLTGPMGMAPSVALGVACARPDIAVLAICGDGALAMNFGALTTVSNRAPRNLTLAVMDNGVYDFTGKLESPSQTVDWEKLISGLKGFSKFLTLANERDIGFSPTGGLALIHCPVKPMAAKAAPFPFTAPEIHKRFKDYIGGRKA